MITLSAKIRKVTKKKVKILRSKGLMPAVLYGGGKKNQNLEVNAKEFEKIYSQAGESSLITLEVEGQKHLVLIHDITKDPLTGKIIHIDFYQPSLKKEIEVKVPIVLEGEAPAVKELGGTLVKNVSELLVKALPQNLPKEIRVNVSTLETFEDHILVKDLSLPKDVKVLKAEDEIVAFVAKPEKVEEELKKPVEEKVEEVKVVGKKKPEEKEETSDTNQK